MKKDNLSGAVVGTSIALVLLTIVGVMAFGGLGLRETAPLAQLPWVMPTAQSFQILAALAIAALCFGRYRALGGAWVFWVGLVYLANGIMDIFYVLSWPGLVGEKGVIAQLSNTAAWVAMLLASTVVLFLPALNARRPERMKTSYAVAA